MPPEMFKVVKMPDPVKPVTPLLVKFPLASIPASPPAKIALPSIASKVIVSVPEVFIMCNSPSLHEFAPNTRVPFSM
jgi:hypothetical protein